MKNIRDLFGLMEKKSFRLELLVVSTSVIVSASAFVYAGMPYQGALNVGNSAGSDVSFTPATIMILLVSAFVAGLSLFSFRREAAKHVSNAPRAGGSLPAVFKSAREDEWEESPRKEEGEVEDEHEPVQD
jgi:heme/copper-type cytochrome/quinol oxidase subunit 3